MTHDDNPRRDIPRADECCEWRGERTLGGHRVVVQFESLDVPASDLGRWRSGALDAVAERLSAIVERCADDLLDVYNTVWADEDPDEGAPPLDRAAFVASFALASVVFLRDRSVSVAFEVGALFGGHQVVLSLDSNFEALGRASLWG